MNLKIVAIILAIVSLILGAGLIYRHSVAKKEKIQDVATIVHFSNQWTEVSQNLEVVKRENLDLERDIAAQTEKLKNYSNNLAAVSANFAKAKIDAKEAADTAREEMRKRDARIAELESERDGMTEKMDQLTGSIADLETQIADTQRRLEVSEGDREFLVKELKRLQAEKSELERQFSDLAALRDQVRKLRDELSISRRLEWIRRGLYGSLKGSELLRKGMASAPGQTNYNLDVEIRREGGATVLTNAPATNAPADSGWVPVAPNAPDNASSLNR